MSSKTKTSCGVCQKTFSSESELFKHNLTWEHRSKLEASSGSKTDGSDAGYKSAPIPVLTGKTKKPTDQLSSQARLSRADTTSNSGSSSRPPGSKKQQQNSSLPPGSGPKPFQPLFLPDFRFRPFLPPPPPPFPPPFPLPGNATASGPHPKYGPRPSGRPHPPPRPLPSSPPLPFPPPPFSGYRLLKRFEPPPGIRNVPFTTQGQRSQAKSLPSGTHRETSVQAVRNAQMPAQPKASLKTVGSHDKGLHVHVGVQTEQRRRTISEGSKGHVQKSATLSVPKAVPEKADGKGLHKDARATALSSHKQGHAAANNAGTKGPPFRVAKGPQGGAMHQKPFVGPKPSGPTNRKGVPGFQSGVWGTVAQKNPLSQKPSKRPERTGHKAPHPHRDVQKWSHEGERTKTDRGSNLPVPKHSSAEQPPHSSGIGKGFSPYKHVTKIIRDKSPKLIPPERLRKSHTVKPLESLEFLPLEIPAKDVEVRNGASVSQEPDLSAPPSSLQLPPTKSGGGTLLFGEVLQMEGGGQSGTDRGTGTLSSKPGAGEERMTEETDSTGVRTTAEPRTESLYESLSSGNMSDMERMEASVENSEGVLKQLNTAITMPAVSSAAVQGPQANTTASGERTAQQTPAGEPAMDQVLSPDSSRQSEVDKSNQSAAPPSTTSGVAPLAGVSQSGEGTPTAEVLPPAASYAPTPPPHPSDASSSIPAPILSSSSSAMYRLQLPLFSTPPTAQTLSQTLSPATDTAHHPVAFPPSPLEPGDRVSPPAGGGELELLQKKIESESIKLKAFGPKAMEEGSDLSTTCSSAGESSLKEEEVLSEKAGNDGAVKHTPLHTPSPPPPALASQGKVTSSPRLEFIVRGLKLRSLCNMPQPSTERMAQEGTGRSFRRTRRGTRGRKRKRKWNTPRPDDGWHKTMEARDTDCPVPKKYKARHKSEGAVHAQTLITGLNTELPSDGESMSVSSSQLPSPQHTDRSALLTPHMKFAADIAALNKRDKELQESLLEVQVQLGKMRDGVQESERKLMELQNQEKQLRERRVGLAEEYSNILIKKQSLFSTPTSSSETSQDVGKIAGLDFFSKLKALSEKEQDLQAQLLRDSQLLEEVGGQRSLEETRLAQLRKEVQIIEQDKLSLLMKDYQDIQRQKQVLVVQWNTPTVSAPVGQQEVDGVLPVESAETQAGDITASTTTIRPTLTETPVDDSDVMGGSMGPQHPVSRSEVHAHAHGETYPKPKPEPQAPFPTDDSSLTAHALPQKSPTRTSASSPEHDLVSPTSASEPTSQMQVAPEIQMPSQKVYVPVDHMAYSQPCPSPLSHTTAHTQPPPPTSVAQSLAGTDRTMLAPIHLPSVNENGAHPDSPAHSPPHPVADSIVSQPTCTSAVGISVTPHHTPSVHSADDSQPTKSTDLSSSLGSECTSTKSASIKLAWEAALAMSSACKEEPEHFPQSPSETDMEECSEEQPEPASDHTGFIAFLHPHESSVLGIKISGNHLYTCSSDKTVKIYDIQTCKEVQRYSNHKRAVTCLEVFRYGTETYIVSGSSDKHIIMYDANTGSIRLKLHVGFRVMYMASQGTLLVAGLSNGFVHAIDLQKRVSLGKFLCHMEAQGKKDITCLCIDGTSLFTASHDNKVICWDISDYAAHPPLPTTTMRRSHCISAFKNIVLCMQVHNDRIYCGSADATLRVFNTKTYKEVGVVTSHGGAISSLCLMGEVLITSCFDRFMRCFDCMSLQLLQVYGRLPNLPFTQCCANGMVYSGLKNGEVKAIEIDLTHFYQCQWSECALKFGIQEHLKQHLEEHLSCDEGSSIQCKWKHCSDTVQHSIVSNHADSHLIRLSREEK